MDEGGHGVGSFTIANQTGRSVRARASVSPFPPASSEWFEVDGATERLMSPGASEEFIVRVSAPVGGETVSRSFRLDIASVDRPDDEWAHGPTIGFMLGNGGSQPAYFETAAGALAGAVAGIVVAVIAGLPAWFVDGRPELDTALVLRSLFVPMFAGDLVIGAALGGAIGIFVALTMRAILSPAPWRTAAAYVVAAFVLVAILELILQFAMPARSQKPDFVHDLLGWVAALIGAALAALAARGLSRWLVLRSV